MPAMGTRPWVAFIALVPQSAEGMRREPRVSVPSAAGTISAASAAADPPLDPPADLSSDHGLPTWSVVPPAANSCVWVCPTSTIPRARSRAQASQSSLATCASRTRRSATSVPREGLLGVTIPRPSADGSRARYSRTCRRCSHSPPRRRRRRRPNRAPRARRRGPRARAWLEYEHAADVIDSGVHERLHAVRRQLEADPVRLERFRKVLAAAGLAAPPSGRWPTHPPVNCDRTDRTRQTTLGPGACLNARARAGQAGLLAGARRRDQRPGRQAATPGARRPARGGAGSPPPPDASPKIWTRWSCTGRLQLWTSWRRPSRHRLDPRSAQASESRTAMPDAARCLSLASVGRAGRETTASGPEAAPVSTALCPTARGGRSGRRPVPG